MVNRITRTSVWSSTFSGMLKLAIKGKYILGNVLNPLRAKGVPLIEGGKLCRSRARTRINPLLRDKF